MNIEKPATKKAKESGCICQPAPKGFTWALSIFGYYIELVDFSYVGASYRANTIFENAKVCPMHKDEVIS